MDKDQIKIAFGEHLTKLRKERELSIHQLAQVCDLEYSHVQRIEKGKVNIALTTLAALAQGLDMSLEELFSGFHFQQ
ncbi:MAG: helix-turn-helix transcriptional regulator [Chitinophagaceae bacterium]|nr:helix-turn-helix transcriptional regulator [Chitinophagaceae bacterium]